MSDTSLWGRLKRAMAPASGVSGSGQRLNSYVVANSQKAPVVRYVDALVGRLVERRDTVTLQAAQDLPKMVGMDGQPLSYGAVVNRLKVLAGLYPVAYPHPTEGRFKHTHRGRRYGITASFDDRGTAAFCRLSVTGPENEAS